MIVTTNQHYLSRSIDKLSRQYKQELEFYDQFGTKFDNFPNNPEEDLNGEWNEYLAAGFNVVSTKYSLVIMIATYVEAIVNFYLALKLNKEQFDAIENCRLIDKWTQIIEILVPEYHLPKGNTIYCQLNELIKARNSIIHMKPKIVRNGSEIHKGNQSKYLDDNHEDRDKILKWTNLPTMLIKNLNSFDSSWEVEFTESSSRPPIEF